ncbi:MAG: tetratricopeptide repeat protein [bacterium]
MKTLYEILEVSPVASGSVIQGAYRALMKNAAHHPDLGGSSAAAQAINEAYAILSNPDTRREYDRTLSQARPAGAAAAQFVFACPHCRRRNLLRDESEVARARCARCRRRLGPRGPAPGRAAAAPRRETDDTRAFRVGMYLFDKRLYDRARWEFQAAVRIKPRDPKYHFWLGRTFYQKRSLASAHAAFKTAALLHPRQFHYRFWLGQTAYAQKNFPAAAENFLAAGKLRPSHLPTLLRLGSCYFRVGDYGAAVEALENSVRRGAGPRQSYTWLGLSQLALNDRPAALNAFRRAERMSPGNTLVQKYIRLCQAPEEGERSA